MIREMLFGKRTRPRERGERLIVKRGRLKGSRFVLEADVRKMNPSGSLPELAGRGNWAARNALALDKYTEEDAPFYYGHIGNLGYIVSHGDLYGEKA